MVSWIHPWSLSKGATRARDRFEATFGYAPDGVWSAPGRVNIIGEHVDYNGGLCLPTALPHRTFVAISWRDDDVIDLVSGAENARWQTELSHIAPGAVSGWGAYPAGVAWALGQAGMPVPGFNAAVESCVPYGAGLSSSAALEASFAVAFANHSSWDDGALDDDATRAFLARICVIAENEIAGANTGGMDQAASLRAQEGHALLLDCLDGSVVHTPFDLHAHDLDLLIIDTHAPHSLVDGQYAQRRATCEEAAAVLGVGTLREVPFEFLNDALDQLPDELSQRRVRHVITEIARVTEFVTALETENFGALGPILDASHASLRDDFEVSCLELDVAVEAARSAGALGARMTGGGFGGSAIALVHLGDHERVAREISEAFTHKNLTAPSFLLAPPSARAF